MCSIVGRTRDEPYNEEEIIFVLDFQEEMHSQINCFLVTDSEGQHYTKSERT